MAAAKRRAHQLSSDSDGGKRQTPKRTILHRYISHGGLPAFRPPVRVTKESILVSRRCEYGPTADENNLPVARACLAPIRSRGIQSDEPFKSSACQSLLCFTRSPAGFIRPSDGNSECAANPVAGAVGVLTCDGLVRVRSGLSLTLVPETFPAILA